MAYSDRIEAPAVEGALAGLGGNWQLDSEPIARQGTHTFNKSPVPAKQRGHAMFETTRTWIAPDLWAEELALLSKPGHSGIPSELFYDHRNQVERLPNLASMDVATRSLAC